MLKRIILVVFFIVSFNQVFVFSNEISRYKGAKILKEELVGLKGILRTVPNNCQKIYVHANGKEYFFIHDKSNFFPIRKEISDMEIISVNVDRLPDNNEPYISIGLKHKYLGKGGIKIYTTGRYGNRRFRLLDIKNVLSYALKIDGFPKYVPYIANKKSKIIHFIGSNHLPPTEDRKEFKTLQDIENLGYTKCSLCFEKIPFVSHYKLEKMLGVKCAAAFRELYPLSYNDELQKKVEMVGNQVLKNWPVSLKGYHYEFRVVESDILNAVACPTGQIFITSSLLKSLEDDEELEAILAHEITHVEKRHGIRQYRKAEIANAIAIIAISAVGMNNKEIRDLELQLGLTSLIISIGTEIALKGYSRKYETEADMYASMYLALQSKQPDYMVSVLKKLQYSGDKLGVHFNETHLFSSHYDLGKRVFLAKNSKVNPLHLLTYNGFNKEDKVVASISFETQYLTEQEDGKKLLSLLAEIKSTPLLEKKDKVSSIKIYSNKKEFKLKNLEKTIVYPNDTTGVTFELVSNEIDFFENIQSIKLKINNVKKWVRV